MIQHYVRPALEREMKQATAPLRRCGCRDKGTGAPQPHHHGCGGTGYYMIEWSFRDCLIGQV